MKYKDIQLLSSEECRGKIKEQKSYLVKLKFAHAISAIENSMQIKKTRKTIARLKTFEASLKSIKG